MSNTSSQLNTPAAIKPRKTRTLIVPLTEEELRELTSQEAIIRESFNDTFCVGEALKKIQQNRLDRGIPGGFAHYCRVTFNMSRRDAYLQIQLHEVYQTVHNCAQINPTNANQVRQLFGLPEEIQQQVWIQAVDLHVEKHFDLTAKLVAQVATRVKAEYKANPWLVYLVEDRLFPGIRKRWELPIKRMLYLKTGVQFSHLQEFTLPNTPKGSPPQEESASMIPLVIISPDRDVLGELLPVKDLQRLVDICATASAWHFLIWAKDLEPFRAITGWPTNISLVLRIERQEDFTAALTPLAQGIPLDTLWIVPNQPLMLPESISVKRVLMGFSGWDDGRSREEVIAFRRLVAACLNHDPQIAVHIATDLHPLFYC